MESLEVRLWYFLNSDDFESALLMPANLDDEADATAAICGGLAGAHYGGSVLPARSLERLAMREEFDALAEALA